MAVLVDTNILLRSVQIDHAMHATAKNAIARLILREERMVVSIQNVAEFWNTAARPELNNGLGFSIEEAREAIVKIESYFDVLAETSSSYAKWKSLVLEQRVSGVQVHDARLVAVMIDSGVQQLLTFNHKDFLRYKAIEILRPESIV